MAVNAAHVLLYTPEPDELRAFFRDVLAWKHVDAGDGWLIFALPPAEVAVHPSEGSTHHELSLVCDDIHATVAELRAKGVEFRGEPEDKGFGITITMLAPGGVEILLYEPRHPLAADVEV